MSSSIPLTIGKFASLNLRVFQYLQVKTSQRHQKTGPIKITDAPPSIEGPEVLKSPMVGTAYLTPDPDSPPFVTVGCDVNEGETVLIIEAMKVMNPIPAHRSGKVKEILVQGSDPVEFGQPIMVIE